MSGQAAVTDGLVFGMSGAPFWLRWLIFAAVACVIQALDVGSTMSVAHGAGLPIPLWQVLVNGYSSIAVLVLMYPPLRALCLAAHPWDGRPLRMVGLHLAGFAAFFLVHFFGQELIRLVVFTLVRGAFAANLLDEGLSVLPRDALTYAVIVALVWCVLRLEARRMSPAQPVAGAATFDIRDGARVIRAPIADITAVVAAGNYVEFILADGRRPLMRATMAAAEASLAPYGFVRTHRAWLVNRGAVTELGPAAPGERAISLAGGVQAPLSRRYRQAAASLSAG